MFERYSERARRAIFFARYEALHRNSAVIDTSDLVLGVIREEPEQDSPLASLHDRAADLCASFGVESVAVAPVPPQNIPLSAQSKMALAYAAQEADRDCVRTISPEHLMRGILRTEDGAAKKVIQAGMTLKMMRSAVKPNRLGKLPVRDRLRIYRLRIILAVGTAVFLGALVYMHFQR